MLKKSWMRSISLPKINSKTLTTNDCISHLLMPDMRLTQEEIDVLIAYSIDVFIACDGQIPIDLATRLYQVQVDLHDFTEVCFEVMSEMEIDENLIIN